MDIGDVAVGLRIQAARKLKKIKNTKELADLVGEAGLGEQTIGAIERGKRRLRRHEAILLAEALNTTVEYLYTGEHPAPDVDPTLAAIEARLAGIELAMHEDRVTLREEIARQNQLLERQSRLLHSIEALVEVLRGAQLEVSEPGEESAQEPLPDPDAIAGPREPERRARTNGGQDRRVADRRRKSA